jgi:hypothetical protein
MECQRKKNLKTCPCTYDCKLKGLCCECIREHRKSDELPACYFSSIAEKTYDRSIKNFIKHYNKRKGYVGLIMLIAGLVFIAGWFFYLWKHNWLGGKLNIPQNSFDAKGQDSESLTNQPPQEMNNQLNQFRQDVKNLQDKKDQEILNELNKK